MRTILAAALVVAALPAQSLSLSWDRTRENAYLTGDIKDGDHWKIINAITGSAARPAYIHLNSKGGDLGAARELALMVRAHGFQTVAETVCASACFAIWMAGSARYVATGTRIGIHSASAWNAATGKWDQRDGQATAALARLYQTLGVPPDLIAKMANTPPSDMYYLTSSDLAELKIIALPE